MKSIHSFLFRVIIISIFIFVIVNCLNAQNDSLIVGRNYRITLLNHFEMTGVVKSITIDTVKIKTDIKTFNVPRKDIATIVDLEKEKVDYDRTHVIFKPEPNESRLLLCPTGKTLKAGHGYISTALLVPWVAVLAFPYANIGVTDYLNFGVGSNINAGLFIETYPNLIFFTPKVRPIHSDNVDVSFGFAHVIQFKNSTSAKENHFGIFYGVSSFDIRNYTLSCGTGITYGIDWGNNNGLTVAPYPLFMLGFEARTETDAKLISENWISFYHDNGFISVLSFGVRQIKGNFTYDISILGLFTNSRFDPGGSSGPKDKPFFIPVLWGSVAYNFEL